MTKDQVSLFLALLAVIAELAVVIALVVAIGGLFSKRLARARGAAAAAVGPQALALAFAVAAVSMLGSLYFSEIAHFPPCALCWYQRIAMYPLVVILFVAAIRGDDRVIRYAGPLAAIGALISIWHIGVERLPGLPSGSCSVDAPCSTIYVQVLGFVTIPTMALAGFLAVITLLLLRSSGGTDPELETPA